jgi:hypothetical protein
MTNRNEANDKPDLRRMPGNEFGVEGCVWYDRRSFGQGGTHSHGRVDKNSHGGPQQRKEHLVLRANSFNAIEVAKTGG